MAMSAHTVTINVPPALFEQLQQRAGQSRRSIEDEVVLTLASMLDQYDRLPEDLGSTLASPSALDDDALRRLVRSQVPEADAHRLAKLADKRQRIGLDAAENAEAEELVERHDRVMLIRAEAGAILHRRGHDVMSSLPSR